MSNRLPPCVYTEYTHKLVFLHTMLLYYLVAYIYYSPEVLLSRDILTYRVDVKLYPTCVLTYIFSAKVGKHSFGRIYILYTCTRFCETRTLNISLQ